MIATLFLLITLILFALYEDDFIQKGRLAVGLSITGIWSVEAFLFSSNRLDRIFLIKWTLFLAAGLLFSFAYGLDQEIPPYWPSTLLVHVLSLVHLGEILHIPLNEEKAIRIFFVYASTLAFFASLVADEKITASPYLTVLVYIPLGVFLLFLLSRWLNANITQIVLDTFLISTSFILFAWKWTGESRILWILAVQPLIGAVFLHGLGMWMSTKFQGNVNGNLNVNVNKRM